MSMLEDVSFGKIAVDELTVDGVKQATTASITVGEEAANVINVAVQLQNYLGESVATGGAVIAYLSDDDAGDSIAATAPDTVAIGTDGAMDAITAGKTFLIIPETDGSFDLDITKSGADTFYLVVVVAGQRVVSDAITFDATT